MTDADKLANTMIADLRDDLIDRLDGSVLVKASDSADLLYSQFASQLEVAKRDYWIRCRGRCTCCASWRFPWSRSSA